MSTSTLPEPIPQERLRSELRSLRLDAPLDEKQCNLLAAKLATDTDFTIAFLNSLYDDLAGTFNFLFILSADDVAYMESVSQDDVRASMGPAITLMSTFIDSGGEIEDVEINYSADRRERNEKKPAKGEGKEKEKEPNTEISFKLTGSGTTGGSSGGGKTWGFEVVIKYRW